MVFRIWCWNTRGRARQTLFPARKKPVARYGIDLGTTFSEVGYLDDGGVPSIIPNAEGQLTSPAIVLFDHDEIVAGDLALSQAATKPAHVIRWVKRAAGDPASGFMVSRLSRSRGRS